MKKGKIFLLAAVLLLAFAQVAFPALTQVGPTNPVNGFPVWYRDSLGQTVTLSVPPNAVSIPDPVIVGNTFSETIGFGSEAFYWHSTATMAVPGGTALLVLGLEAAFAGGDALAGDQIVFARVRMRIDTAVAGDYTVTHPYGSKTFTGVVAGNRAINDTSDVGIGAPGVFTGALSGAIGPFLKQAVPAPPAGTLGDAATSATVINGPNGNSFTVTGPGVNATTNQFITGAELFNGTPFKIVRTTFTRGVAGNFMEVFASVPAPLPTALAVRAVLAPGFNQPLTRVGTNFFGRFQFTNAFPPAGPIQLTVRANSAGVAQTNTLSPLVDVITINQATYSVGTGTLTIAATSTDSQAQLRGFGWIGAGAAGQPLAGPAGQLTTFVLPVPPPNPPATITVKSALGGTESVKTVILP